MCVKGNKICRVFVDAGRCSTKEAKSFSGSIIMIGYDLISSKSGKQSLVALFTMARCDGVCELEIVKHNSVTKNY